MSTVLSRPSFGYPSFGYIPTLCNPIFECMPALCNSCIVVLSAVVAIRLAKDSKLKTAAQFVVVLIVDITKDYCVVLAPIISEFYSRVTETISEDIMFIALKLVLLWFPRIFGLRSETMFAMFASLTATTYCCGRFPMILLWLNVWFNLHITFCPSSGMQRWLF